MTLNADSIIAVVGAGAMGSGIAQVAAQASHLVIVVDADAAALERSRKAILGALDKLVHRGRLTEDRRVDVEARLRWTQDMAAVAPAALTIEAIVENLEVKTGLFQKLAALVAPDAILASNTSSLSISAMASAVPHPRRFAGLHFFNPVTAMKLVEVVPGDDTDTSVIDDLLALMQDWGKVAVPVRDVPGFIVNRVARPYYAEGFAALAEGIEPATIDHALEAAGEFRMGPLALSDMIGHDVNFTVAKSVFDAYDGKTRFRPQAAQQALFEGGRLGRKSGRGVYDHGQDALPAPSFLAPSDDFSGSVTVAKDQDRIGRLVDLLRTAGLPVSVDEALPSDTIRVDGQVVALGDGRLLSERHGIDALLDHARDFRNAASWIVTARTDAAALAMANLGAALGKRVLRLPDRPGQIVLRTLAQLANAAADAVSDGVANALDVDSAMRFGANHPEGPLAWAAHVGHATVYQALDHIAQATGDALYRPAAYFAPAS